MFALLLPPSEGKSPGGTGPGWDPRSGRFGPALERPRQSVARALRSARGGDQRLLGVSGDHLDRARAANRALVGAPTLPAGERFTGVVWDHLDLTHLPPGARSRASDAIVVVSAVAGLVAIDDLLPDHRLKMSARLDRVGKLATMWRDPLSAVLNDHLAGRFVVDLLPAEHAAAWVPTPDRYDLVRVRLVDRDGRTAGHAAKAAKGRLARDLLLARSPRRALERWIDDAFSLDIAPPA